VISGSRIWNTAVRNLNSNLGQLAEILKIESSTKTNVLRAKDWLEKRGYYVYRFGDWYIEAADYKSWGKTDNELIAFAREKGMEVEG